MTDPIQTGQRLLFLLAVLCAGLVRLPGQDFGDLIQQMRDLRNRDWGRPDREDAAARGVPADSPEQAYKIFTAWRQQLETLYRGRATFAALQQAERAPGAP